MDVVRLRTNVLAVSKRVALVSKWVCGRVRYRIDNSRYVGRTVGIEVLNAHAMLVEIQGRRTERGLFREGQDGQVQPSLMSQLL